MGNPMRRSLALLATLASFATPAVADGPVVLELFTSQGCSSCPPADEMLHELASRTDVIPLALHVDYWDYIGWADLFADPEHTTRQQAYVRFAGGSTIYTPQMIIGGVDHVIGAKSMQVADAITRRNVPNGVQVELQRTDDQLVISGVSTQSLPEGTIVQLVRFNPNETVEVQRGENAGRTWTYSNIVQSWDVVGEWSGSEDLTLDVAVEGPEPMVVIVQEPGPGAILASAVLR